MFLKVHVLSMRSWNSFRKTENNLEGLNYNAAVISDIHGNLTALTAVMETIERLRVDDIFCLGDVIGKGAFPSQALDICRRRCIQTLMGNHEDFFLKGQRVDHYDWIRRELSGEQIQWLSNRPIHHDLHISGKKIRLSHAGPDNVHLRVYSKHDRNRKLELFKPLGLKDSPVDIYGYGDIHYAYIEYFDSCRILFNSGSVGNSMELPQASFVLLSGIKTEPAVDHIPITDYKGYEPLGIQFFRVPYDIDKEVELTLSSSMPEKGQAIYLEEIKSGTWGKRWSRYT